MPTPDLVADVQIRLAEYFTACACRNFSAHSVRLHPNNLALSMCLVTAEDRCQGAYEALCDVAAQLDRDGFRMARAAARMMFQGDSVPDDRLYIIGMIDDLASRPLDVAA